MEEKNLKVDTDFELLKKSFVILYKALSFEVVTTPASVERGKKEKFWAVFFGKRSILVWITRVFL